MLSRVSSQLLRSARVLGASSSSRAAAAVPSWASARRAFADAVEEEGPAFPISENGMNFNFCTPSQVFVQQKVHMVTAPGEAGELGVLDKHVPTVAPLKPGVLTVHFGDVMDKDVRHWFISGGFMMVSPEDTSVTAVEAVDVADLDAAAVASGLAAAKQQMTAATTDEEKALAQIAVDVHEAMQHGLAKA